MTKIASLRNMAGLSAILALSACTKPKVDFGERTFLKNPPVEYLSQFDYSGEKIPSAINASLHRITTSKGDSYITKLGIDDGCTDGHFDLSPWAIEGIDVDGDLRIDEVYLSGDVPGHLRFLGDSKELTKLTNHTFAEYITK